MAVVCGDCQTENRDGARFCKGCGRKLGQGAVAAGSADWAETQRMPLPIPVAPPGIFDAAPTLRPAVVRDEAKVIAGALSRPSPPSGSAPRADRPTVSAKSRPVPASGPRASRAPWRLGGVIAALVVVGGGWYVYGTGTNNQAAGIAPMTPPPPAARPAATPITPSIEAQMVAPTRPKADEPAPPPAPSPAAVAKPHAAAAVAVAPKARKPAPAPAVTPTPVIVAAPPPPAPVAPPAPAAPPNPQTACADLSFFSRARCMAAQCAKADFKASPQCDGVRRQQQIDEEKRNPTLAG